MRRASVLATCCCAIAGLAIGASTPKKKTAVAPKVSATKAAPKGTATKRPAVARATTGSRTAATSRTPVSSRGKSTGKTVASRRYVRPTAPRQIVPTPDRYKEIQDALSAKGYLVTPGTGVWDAQSMDAMKRFQQDQRLEPSGKLTARSLTALGLGTKPPDSGSGVGSPISSLGTPLGEPAQLH